jgi:type I site-specific restriction endonuclease
VTARLEVVEQEKAALSDAHDALLVEVAEATSTVNEARAASQRLEREVTELRKELKNAHEQVATAAATTGAAQQASDKQRVRGSGGGSWRQDILDAARDQGAPDVFSTPPTLARSSHVGPLAGAGRPDVDVPGDDDFDREIARLARHQASRGADTTALKQELAALKEAMRRQSAESDRALTRLSRELEARKVDARRIESLDYVRNVVVQFIMSQTDEIRQKMIPAIVAVLEIGPKEREAIQRVNPKCPPLH